MNVLIPELYCTSLTISLDFYINMLGFNILYQRADEGFAMLERQDTNIMLNEISTQSNTSVNRVWLTAPLEVPFGRGVNFQIKTDNVDQLYADIQRAKCNIYLPIEEKWYRANDVEIGQRQFIVLDPDGYMLRFCQELGVRR